MGQEDEIRLIAYRIWEKEGCLNGRDCEHWYKAEVIWNQQQKAGDKKEEFKAVSKQSNRPPTKVKASKKKKHA